MAPGVDLREGELLEGLAEAIDRARGRRRLVSATARVELEDPVATVFASRLAGDRWFAWEQPDRDGFALAGLGAAHEAVSRGPGRWRDLIAETAEITRGRLASEPVGLPAGAGPVWTGGFAFADDGGSTPPWSSFPPALLVMPELSILRDRGQTWLTLSAVLGAGEERNAALARLERRLGSLRTEPLGLIDPSPRRSPSIRSVEPPSHYERIVAEASGRIRAGELEKVVLAREVVVEATSAHDPAPVFGALREVFGSCLCFCVGSPEGAFIGASPELLIRRRGAGAATVALAGSTRRSADPAVDDHLGEQLRQSAKNRIEHAVTARWIERLLAPRAVWVEAEREPRVIRVANIQHLATPIHAQLADPLGAVELAALMHPTPAVGGDPRPDAIEAIAELERLDRGWYAGPIGWVDCAEDGEFCVGLRSALLRDRSAHLIVGAGIVGDSDPETELAETELKLEAMLPLLAG